MKRALSLLLALILTLSLIGMVPFTGSVAAGNTTALDEDTDLTNPDAIEAYQDTGITTVSNSVPQMTFTVADSSEDVGVTGLRYTDFDTTYLRVQYEESLERTVRFYVPNEYWHPFPDTNEAVNSDVTATMEPVEGTEYTAVTIHFEEETDAVFEVKSQASVVFAARDYGESWLESEVGVDIPGTAQDGGQWEYVPTAELTTDSPTFGIEAEATDLTIQYDRSNTSDPADTQWRSVPSCSSSSSSETPVCSYTQQGNNQTVYILSQTDDPPDIRFKHDAGFLTDFTASWGELGDIVNEVLEDARDLIDRVTG